MNIQLYQSHTFDATESFALIAIQDVLNNNYHGHPVLALRVENTPVTSRSSSAITVTTNPGS